MFCRVACFLLAGLFLSPSALAADMPTKAAYPVTAFSWVGPYIGAVGGYAFGQSRHCDTPAHCTDSFDVDGATAGGTFGYNWQWTNWVLGAEADMSYANAKGSTGSRPGSFSCGTADPTCRTNLDWFGTVRGRVGTAFDKWLPYVTGGYAVGRMYADLGVPTTGATGTKSGWTAGAGVEYAFGTGHWSAKLEYLYVQFDDLFYDTAQVCGLRSCTAVENRFNILRLGVNYRF